LALAGVAGAAIDPLIWAAIIPAQLAVLWAVPDLPPFRAAIDERHRRRAMLKERAFYLDYLWGLRPPAPLPVGKRLMSLFVEQEVDDLDERVINRDAEFERYLEIRQIVSKLAEMQSLPSTRITDRDIQRFENVVNAYAGLLVACRTLYRACSAIDPDELRSELAELGPQLEGADMSLRSVLFERKRLIETQLTRRPKLEATLDLLRARIDTIGHQLRNIESQVVTFPGIQLHEVLDDIIERNEILADPLAELAADQDLRSMLASATVAMPGPRDSQPPAVRAAAARVGLKR
jgi:hypothetical protein